MIKRPERPRGVTVIAVLYGISAALLLIEAYAEVVKSGFVAMAGLFLAGAVGLIVWGLLEMATWARFLALALSVLLLILEGTTLWSGMMNGQLLTVINSLINISVNAWIIFYLFQPKIAAAFRRSA